MMCPAKKYVYPLFLLFCHTGIYAQIQRQDDPDIMRVKENNYTSFELGIPHPVLEKFGQKGLDVLEKYTEEAYKQHPEYGQIPYKTQCDSCVELIQKRTASTRYYIDINHPESRFYIEQCYGDLHFFRNDRWITINPFLKPDEHHPNVYIAPDQPVPVKIDRNTGYTSILIKGHELRFNGKQTLYFYKDGVYTNALPIQDIHTTLGDDGAYTIDAWPAIDREQEVRISEVETKYTLKHMPAMPQGTEALVIEDILDIPDDFKVMKKEGHVINGLWTGDLSVLDAEGTEILSWSMPVIFDDQRQHITCGYYDVVKEYGKWKIRLLVDAGWLRDTAQFPVIIDPLVSGSNTYSTGVIGFSQYQAGNGFCGSSSQYCSAFMTVVCPGQSTITNVIWKSDYYTNNTYKCSQFSFPFWFYHYCRMNDGGFRMVGPCGETPLNTNSWWNCNPGCNFYGTCSGSMLSEPYLATCTPPQCPDYNLTFELRNIHCNTCSQISCGNFTCSTVCQYTPNNSWTITIEARTVESNSTANSVPVTFTGSCNVPFTINANPAYGVPAYTYNWNTGQTVQSFTDTKSANGTYTYTCTVTDACGQTSVSTVQVVINDCPLPVELLEFSGSEQNGHVLLSWKTGTEENSDFFLVQRSTDASEFISIGKVPAAVHSNTETSYEYTDYNPPAGRIYYRLQLVDRDGNIKWSNVISVAIMGAIDLDVFPNPAPHEFHIGFEYNGNANRAELILYNAMGQPVYIMTPDIKKGNHVITIRDDDLPHGFYLIKLSVGGSIYKGTIVISE